MGVVSEVATTVAENAVPSRKLKLKILTKKPAIGACELSEQMPLTSCMEKSTLINDGGSKKLNSILGTKRRPEGAIECPREEKTLKMDRSATLNCQVILGKLMKHRHGFPFNHPVDPVAYRIPDYFDIIKKPMDLGTIKWKLDKNMFYGVEEFESDVRLTFSNAMLYNPPNNAVHQYAKELIAIFDNLWKPMKAKLNRQFENKKQKSSENNIGKTTHDVNKTCLKILSSHEDKLSGKTMVHEGRDPKNFKVQLGDMKTIKEGNAKGSKSSKTCRPDPDSGGLTSMSPNPEILSRMPVQSTAKVKHENAKEGKPSKKVSHDVCKDVKVKNTLTSQLTRSEPDSDGALSCLDEERACTSFPVSTSSIGATTEAMETVLDVQLSPSKALRAAMLKSRFADTILKAQHKTLLQPGDKADPVKLQQEKERLEKRQREEKERIEAQIRAAESAARLKAESDLRKQRQQQREAARIALEKMERSVDLDDNFHVLRDLEALIGSALGILCNDGKSRHANMWNEISSGKLRSPLERLGLFIKEEYIVGDDDDDSFLVEGDWEEGEVAF